MRVGTRQIYAAWKVGRVKFLSSRALWTDGASIYSYGTAVLARVSKEDVRREGLGHPHGCVVLNRSSYSNTTTCHQNGLAECLSFVWSGPGQDFSYRVLEVGSLPMLVEPADLVDVAFARITAEGLWDPYGYNVRRTA